MRLGIIVLYFGVFVGLFKGIGDIGLGDGDNEFVCVWFDVCCKIKFF